MLAAEASGPSWGVWVTAAGVVVTAVAAAIATAYTANKNVREVELSYAQRLPDSYLNNAREYLQSVYLPVHLAVTDLIEAHRDFRAHADRAAGTALDDALAAFLAAIDGYDTTVAGLLGRAAGAFLTTALEETTGGVHPLRAQLAVHHGDPGSGGYHAGRAWQPDQPGVHRAPAAASLDDELALPERRLLRGPAANRRGTPAEHRVRSRVHRRGDRAAR